MDGQSGGVLEKFLSKLRAQMADRVIPASARQGRILDLGCGQFPFFLSQTDFKEKIGIDRLIDTEESQKAIGNILLYNQDIEKDFKLPFPDAHFETVTFLASFEHIEPAKLPELHNEIYRVLKKGGVYVMTTPAAWADWILRVLAKIRFIDGTLFAEHKDVYTHQKIESVLGHSDFKGSRIRRGTFELGMNLWLTAEKNNC